MMKLLLLFSLTQIVASNQVLFRDDYQIWCTGICDHDAKTTTTPGVVLMGGGTDTNEAFAWQSKNANGGDFVVMRTSGDEAYNEYIFELAVASGHRLNSVTTILFNNKKASSADEVLDKLRNAEAIFMAGGDQSDYMSFWVGTDVQTIMQHKSANITIGGTSAGCAVLGNWVYSASAGSITSDEAMSNPYHKYVTLVPAFLKFPYLESIITDTHFVTRDRMGRMLTFVGRLLQDAADPPAEIVRGVGIDEHTALLLDVSTGSATAVGVGTAYVCTGTADPEICKAQTSLTFTGVSCTRLSASKGDVHSFADWTTTGTPYTNDIVAAKFTSLPYGPV